MVNPCGGYTGFLKLEGHGQPLLIRISLHPKTIGLGLAGPGNVQGWLMSPIDRAAECLDLPTTRGPNQTMKKKEFTYKNQVVDGLWAPWYAKCLPYWRYR